MTLTVDPEGRFIFDHGTLRFPVELRPPPGFRPDEPATWPQVEGRLEYVAGRLLYMPPCGDFQQDVAIDVAFQLRLWAEQHPGFLVGGNEAGIRMHGDTRGADAAVWRAADLPPRSGRYRPVPPVLAVEVAGEDAVEPESTLREKARWYLDHGVIAVWLVLPRSREVVVLLADGSERRYGAGDVLAEHPALPGLRPAVKDFFAQLDR